MSQEKFDQQIIHHELALDTYFSALLEETIEDHSHEKELTLIVDVDQNSL